MSGVLHGAMTASFLDLPVKAGLQLWMDAADTTKITHSSNSVSAWTDKSPNGYVFSQNTAGNYPLTNTNTINGRNVIEFNNGTTTHVLTNTANSLFRNTQFQEIFIVLRQATTSGEMRPFIKNVGPGNLRTALVFNRTGTGALGKFEILAKAPDSSSNYGYISTTSISTASRLYNARLDFSAGGGGIKVNNGPDETTAASNVTVPPSSTTTSDADGSDSYIGNNPANTTQCFKGDIAEIVIYSSSLSTASRLLINRYLMVKWGLS